MWFLKYGGNTKEHECTKDTFTVATYRHDVPQRHKMTTSIKGLHTQRCVCTHACVSLGN